MRLTKSHLKKIIKEESQAVLAERRELQRQRSIMLAESKRIDNLHEISLSDVASFAKNELPHLALDVAGLIPGFGEGADLANAGLYISKGEYFMAALSLLSMIPAVGDVVGKGGKFLTKFGDDAGKASKYLGGLLKKYMPQIQKLLKTLKDNPVVGPHVDDILRAVTKYIDDAAEVGAKAGKETLQRLQQAIQTRPVKPIEGGTLKKLAVRTKARKDREKAASALQGREQEAAE
jgi:hypothetical protein